MRFAKEQSYASSNTHKSNVPKLIDHIKNPLNLAEKKKLVFHNLSMNSPGKIVKIRFLPVRVVIRDLKKLIPDNISILNIAFHLKK